jgi:hypothetical protein
MKTEKFAVVAMTIDEANQLHAPPFQRPMRLKSRQLKVVAEIIRNENILPGVITLGKVENDPLTYLVDGQHRIEAFNRSGIEIVTAKIDMMMFKDMNEMSLQFDRLNTPIAKMSANDRLKSMSFTNPVIHMIMEECSFVGFHHTQLGQNAAKVLQLSVALRSWKSGKSKFVGVGSHDAVIIGETISEEEAKDLIKFLKASHKAFGNDKEYFSLWGNLNLSIVAWLWIRLILERVPRVTAITEEDFVRCMMSLGSDNAYVPWLKGKNLSVHSRSPCYTRVKDIFAKRLREEGYDKRILFPGAEWVTS